MSAPGDHRAAIRHPQRAAPRHPLRAGALFRDFAVPAASGERSDAGLHRQRLDLVTILLAPAALLVKGYRWWRGRGPELSHRTATFLVVLYFLYFPVDLWWVSRTLAADAQNPALYSALLAAIHLLLFAMIVRLFSATHDARLPVPGLAGVQRHAGLGHSDRGHDVSVLLPGLPGAGGLHLHRPGDAPQRRRRGRGRIRAALGGRARLHTALGITSASWRSPRSRPARSFSS